MLITRSVRRSVYYEAVLWVLEVQVMVLIQVVQVMVSKVPEEERIGGPMATQS